MVTEDKLLGAETPWMYYYLTDDGKTIHYSSTVPSAKEYYPISVWDGIIDYTYRPAKDATKAVFDNKITAKTCGYFKGG